MTNEGKGFLMTIEELAHESRGPWKCFHCGEIARTREEAVLHFGKSEHAQPMCQIDAAAFRAMEELTARYREEDSDFHRQMARMAFDHDLALRRQEEAGYARGLQDGQTKGSQPVATAS